MVGASGLIEMVNTQTERVACREDEHKKGADEIAN
jgi:hypothetical protein